MYDSDGAVEKDVALLRRKLRELPVEQQVCISHHGTLPNRGESRYVWWVVSVPTALSDNTNRMWFYLERNKGSDGGVHVKDPDQNMRVVATLPTVESAYFAGAILIERPS